MISRVEKKSGFYISQEEKYQTHFPLIFTHCSTWKVTAGPGYPCGNDVIVNFHNKNITKSPAEIIDP